MKRLVTTDKQQQRNSLIVTAAGLCCSVGYHLSAAVCALRANMDHFQESTFYSTPTTPLNVAMLPDDIYGHERLQRWVEYAVRDCANNLPEPTSLFNSSLTTLIVLGPDMGHWLADQSLYAELAQQAMAALGADMAPQDGAAQLSGPYHIDVMLAGRTGLAQALQRAAQQLVNGDAEQVLLIAADSYLNTADINLYLDQQRLFVPGNSNGFLPGEAAVALLLRPAQTRAAGLHIRGVGIAHENGRQDGSVPSRGQGLTQAIRAACDQAKIAPTDLCFRISDQNGEQFYSNDGANAVTRIMFGAHKLTQLTLADKIGEVGAASGPAMLAWLHRDMQDPKHSPGSIGLLHLANDDGTRCAIVVHQDGDH